MCGMLAAVILAVQLEICGKPEGLKMTLELQSNIASKMTFKLVFFKCSLAKNNGVKLDVSSHFSALGSQKSDEQK